MKTPRLVLRTAPSSSRGGFTLVELLVVIAIIAILAAVALPAITGAIKKAKENAAVQSAHGLSLGMFQFANDNNEIFPGTTANVTVTSSTLAFQLLVPSYISNTDVFYLPVGSKQKLSAAGSLTQTNVSWDMTCEVSDVGLTSTDPDTVPLVFTTGTTMTYGAAGSVGPCTAKNNPATGSANPFGTDGMAIAYKDGSSEFAAFTSANAATGGGTGYNTSSVSFDPPTTYVQLQP
jgi:prepilin-type N-terminal cleavage/methylation domain-containing protein